MKTALSFDNVRKRFGNKVALHGFSLDVPTGALFGLIGPNGAGKTTAFSIACGFLRPDAGGVSILESGGFDAGHMKGRISAMPQDAALGRETTCEEHLIFFARLQGLERKAAVAETARVLSEVGLADRARSKTKTLSHGMLRRLMVAQAFIGSPELILLDEPTSGLDPRHAHELREMFGRSHRAGQTIIVSSHNLPELEQICDHVAFIDNGHVTRAGRTSDVTGTGEEIEIQLGGDACPMAALTAALPNATIEQLPEKNTLRIRFSPESNGPGPRDSEDVIGIALRVLLDNGARISGVRKGASLERKFLEMR